mgnify:CR=1 FL=1
MVIDDLYIRGSGGRPDEANAVLVVDPNTVLAEPITFQDLQAISRRDSQVNERLGRVE